MANNTTLPGTGEIYASDERGGAVNFQKVLVEALDGPSVDAFGRWRVSQPKTIFDTKLLHGSNHPLLWDEALESGTMATSGPTAAKPFIDFTSTNVTAGKRTRQTFRRFVYQPGKSHLVVMTGVLELASGVTTGCERRIGAFDDDNGVFFESDAGTIGVTVRTNDTGSPVDTTVVQASWNIDTMDGGNDAANPSGITLDATTAHIFVMDFQWLSAGRVRFGFEIGGLITYVHEHNVANSGVIPWSSTPNLPLRYQIITTTSSGICSMRCICAAIISEGGRNPTGVTLFQSTAGAGVTTGVENTIYAVIGLRLKSDHLGSTIRLLNASIQVQTVSEFLEWMIIHNPTVADTFAYSDVTNSAVQRALGATANTVTGGTQLHGGHVETGKNSSGGDSISSGPESTLELGASIAGVRDTVVLCVRPIGGVSTATVEGGLTWRESD